MMQGSHAPDHSIQARYKRTNPCPCALPEPTVLKIARWIDANAQGKARRAREVQQASERHKGEHGELECAEHVQRTQAPTQAGRVEEKSGSEAEEGGKADRACSGGHGEGVQGVWRHRGQLVQGALGEGLANILQIRPSWPPSLPMRMDEFMQKMSEMSIPKCSR